MGVVGMGKKRSMVGQINCFQILNDMPCGNRNRLAKLQGWETG